MSQILPGVPATVPLDTVIEVAALLGLDARQLQGLEFHPRAIFATIYANRDGEYRDDGTAWRFTADDNADQAAVHRVCIPITIGPGPDDGQAAAEGGAEAPS